MRIKWIDPRFKKLWLVEWGHLIFGIASTFFDTVSFKLSLTFQITLIRILIFEHA